MIDFKSIQKRQTEVVKGSLADIAKATGKTIAEAFIDAECVALVDVSGSMSTNDSRDGQRRYDVACQELAKLQEKFPGKVAVISFATVAKFCPGGTPTHEGGGTDVAEALKFTKIADVEGMRFFLISDGQPDDETAAMKVAGTYKCRIDTIYVGAMNDTYARNFLTQLASNSGGQALTADRVDGLGEKMMKLLAVGA